MRLNFAAEIWHFDDLKEYTKNEATLTPCVIVGGIVISSGSAPSVEDLKKKFRRVKIKND